MQSCMHTSPSLTVWLWLQNMAIRVTLGGREAIAGYPASKGVQAATGPAYIWLEKGEEAYDILALTIEVRCAPLNSNAGGCLIPIAI
jgi:hypothetical protein